MHKENWGRWSLINLPFQREWICTDSLTSLELFILLQQLREITWLYESAAVELKMKNKSLLYYTLQTARANQCLQHSSSLFFWHQATPKNPDAATQFPLLLAWSKNSPFRTARCCSVWRLSRMYHTPSRKKQILPVKIHRITGLSSDADTSTKCHCPRRVTEVWGSIHRSLSWVWSLGEISFFCQLKRSRGYDSWEGELTRCTHRKDVR